MLTYKQAYDKIIEAYFKDEIKPMNIEFCFCGTLNNNSSSWRYGNGEYGEQYTIEEFGRMERALFSTLKDARYIRIGMVASKSDFMGSVKYTEDELFAGMSAALDVLKQIHIERGEIIDDVPVFTKRQLQTQN